MPVGHRERHPFRTSILDALARAAVAGSLTGTPVVLGAGLLLTLQRSRKHPARGGQQLETASQQGGTPQIACRCAFSVDSFETQQACTLTRAASPPVNVIPGPTTRTWPSCAAPAAATRPPRAPGWPAAAVRARGPAAAGGPRLQGGKTITSEAPRNRVFKTTGMTKCLVTTAMDTAALTVLRMNFILRWMPGLRATKCCCETRRTGRVGSNKCTISAPCKSSSNGTTSIGRSYCEANTVVIDGPPPVGRSEKSCPTSASSKACSRARTDWKCAGRAAAHTTSPANHQLCPASGRTGEGHRPASGPCCTSKSDERRSGASWG